MWDIWSIILSFLLSLFTAQPHYTLIKLHHIVQQGFLVEDNHTFVFINKNCCSELAVHFYNNTLIVEEQFHKPMCKCVCPVLIRVNVNAHEVVFNGKTLKRLQRFCGQSFGECKSDDDCVISGCNHEVCAPQHVVSPCVAKQCFSTRPLYTCGCVNGKCAWKIKPFVLQTT
jgi:eight-cysteine-cluster-containing protein